MKFVVEVANIVPDLKAANLRSPDRRQGQFWTGCATDEPVSTGEAFHRKVGRMAFERSHLLRPASFSVDFT